MVVTQYPSLLIYGCVAKIRNKYYIYCFCNSFKNKWKGHDIVSL